MNWIDEILLPILALVVSFIFLLDFIGRRSNGKSTSTPSPSWDQIYALLDEIKQSIDPVLGLPKGIQDWRDATQASLSQVREAQTQMLSEARASSQETLLKIEDVTEQISILEGKLSTRIATLDQEWKTGIEQRLENLQQVLDGIRNDLEDVKPQIAALEKKTSTRRTSLDQEWKTGVEQKLETLQQTLDDLRSILSEERAQERALVPAIRRLLTERGYKICPSCGNSTVPIDANFCYFCGYKFEEGDTRQ